MKRKLTVKRVISVFLAIVMVCSMAVNLCQTETKAATGAEGQQIDLVFRNYALQANGNPYLLFDLPSELSSAKDNTFYAMDAYINGEDTAVTVWMTVSKYWNGLIFWSNSALDFSSHNLKDITSLVVKSGTTVSEFDHSNMKNVENGNVYTLGKEIRIIRTKTLTWADTRMLEIKLQDNAENASIGTEKFDIRFITSVDSLDYNRVGFVFSLTNEAPTKGGEKCIEKSGTFVYTSLNVNGTPQSVTSIYDSYSKYMYAFEILNVPANRTIYTRSFVELLDGTIVYGDTKVVTAPGVKGNPDFVKDGTSTYSILIPENATKNEAFAAEELQYFFQEATGVTLPIVHEREGETYSEYIAIGETESAEAANVSVSYEQLKTSGFVLKTVNKNCYIKGYSDRGTRNGVYEFLRQCFDYECYAADEIYLTKKSELQLEPFDIAKTASFDYREAVGTTTWDDTAAIRMGYDTNAELFVLDRLYHNSFTIINPSTYDYTSDTYKGWYASTMAYNQQLKKELPVQLCYSNEEMRAEYVKRVKELLETEDDPILILGQEDGAGWCTCEKCAASKEKYDTDGAVLIQFMNYVQQEIRTWYETEHPEKEPVKIAFWAYDPTKEPPVTYNESTQMYEPKDDTVKVDEDLVVYFAIGGNVGYSLNATEAECSERAERKKMLEGWNALTDNIFMLSLDVYPNDTFIMCDSFNVMQENCQVALENGVMGISVMTDTWQSGDYAVGWEQAKTYVMSRLQWNVNSDVDMLLKNFFDNYYDKAGNTMKSLFDKQRTLYQQAFKDGKLTTCMDTELLTNGKTYWTETWLADAMTLIEQAYKDIAEYEQTDPERYQALYDRITVEALQFRYLQIKLYSSTWDSIVNATKVKETRFDFRDDASRLGITSRKENVSIESLWTEWECSEETVASYLAEKIDDIVVKDKDTTTYEKYLKWYEHLSETGKKTVTSARYEKLQEAIYLAQLIESGVVTVNTSWGTTKYSTTGEALNPVGIRISQNTLNLLVDSTIDLNGMTIPYYANGTVSYSIADTSVATVTSAGKLTVKAAGTTILTMTVSGSDISREVPIHVYTEWNEVELRYMMRTTHTSAAVWLEGTITGGKNSGLTLTEAYGSWKSTLYGSVTYTAGGNERTEEGIFSPTAVNLDANNANLHLITADGNMRKALQAGTLSQITIPAGTVLECKAGGTDQNTCPIFVTKDFSISLDKNGNSEQMYNEIELDFIRSGSDGKTFAFTPKIVSGPNRGASVAGLYGNWPNPSPVGEITFVRNGTEVTMKVFFSTYKDYFGRAGISISGNYNPYVSELTQITVKAGTVVIPTYRGIGAVLTDMRIVKDVTLVKQNGIWVMK